MQSVSTITFYGMRIIILGIRNCSGAKKKGDTPAQTTNTYAYIKYCCDQCDAKSKLCTKSTIVLFWILFVNENTYIFRGDSEAFFT